MMTYSKSEMLQMVEKIAHTHHEKCDVSGYPKKLYQDQIPPVGGIAMKNHQINGFLLIAFLISFFCMHCDQISEGMVKMEYEEGFSLRHPAHWHARVVDKAFILVSSENEQVDPSFILIQPFFLTQGGQSQWWIKEHISKITQFFPNLTILKMKSLRSQPDEAAVKFKFQRNNQDFLGIALCSIQKKSGILYVMATRQENFAQDKDKLLAILHSFRFERPKNSQQKSVSGAGVEYIRWHDPKERAFSLDVPKNWHVTGGTFRRASVDLVQVLRAESPEKNVLIQFNDNNIPVFTTPNPTLAMAGFREGSWYSPGYGVNMMVRSYLPGLYFLNSYLQTYLRPHVVNFKLVSQKDRPDIVNNFNEIYKQFLPAGISFTLHAGDVAFQYGKNNQSYVGYGLAMTQVVQSQGMGQWSVALMILYTCPPEEADTVRHISNHMFQSVKVNPHWASSQQQLAVNVSKIVTRTNQEISRIIDDSYWTRQISLDNINRRFSNYILGVTDVVDSATGEKWTVEAGHNYYWIKDYTGQVVGTDTGVRPDIDFSPLKEF